MAADREDYPEDGFSEYDDPASFEQTRARRAVGMAGQSRDTEAAPPRSTTRRSASAGRHQAPGRHAASSARPATRRRAAERVPAPQPAAPAAVPAQTAGHHRPISKRRRRRKMIALFALLLVLAAGFAAANMVVGRVKGFQVASATDGGQVLSWNRAGGVDHYDIYDGQGKLLKELAADEGCQYAVEGLKSSTRYTYSIVGVKSFFGRHTGKAAECSGYTLPETVSALAAMNSGTGALLTWDDSGAGGYEVQYTDGYSEPKTLEAKGRDAEGLSIPDLQEGAQYTFQIRGFVQDGDSRLYSDWSVSEPITAVHTADMTGVDVTKPMVALTFDDGPDYGDVTDRILAALKEYGGHASFFQEGASASALPELMSRIAEAGHEIACHTYDHSHYGSNVTADDIVLADDAIEQATGKRPTAFRSPGGETTDLIRNVCVSEKMPIFYWSIDTEDWKSRDADAVCDAVMGHVSDGDIVLMHNVYDSTADAVERIVPYLVEEGYQLVTVSQLVQAKTGKPPVPGTQYITATQTN